MQVVSDRRYTFAVDAAAVWDAFTAVEAYQQWWPWLHAFEASGLAEGEIWRCAVRAPLPYTLRFTVSLVEVTEPSLIRARVDGDIAGDAVVRLTPAAGGCEVRLTSSLVPARRSFTFVAAIARPGVVWAHHRVVDRGAAQFAKRALGEARPAPA